MLHHTPADGAKLKAEVTRDGQPVELTFTLPEGWRRADDISWRVGSWTLRRMTTGGMVLEELAAGDRPAGVPADGMALRVKHVGQYGPNAAAKNAGFRVGDVIVAFDGKTDLTTEVAVFEQGFNARKPGDKVPVKVVRGGKPFGLTLPMQE